MAQAYLPKPKLAIEGPGGVQASFDFQGARNDVAGRMLTVTLTNDLDGTVSVRVCRPDEGKGHQMVRDRDDGRRGGSRPGRGRGCYRCSGNGGRETPRGVRCDEGRNLHGGTLLAASRGYRCGKRSGDCDPGISDVRGVAAAFVLGASAVQIGTGFLCCPEAKMPSAWTDAIGRSLPEETLVTRAFSGRAGRSIATAYARAASTSDAPTPAPYPVQRGLAQAMRDAAMKTNDIDRMQAWAGQSARFGAGATRE